VRVGVTLLVCILMLAGCAAPSEEEKERIIENAFGVTDLYEKQPGGMHWISDWRQPRNFDGVDPRDEWFDADHGEASFKVSKGVLNITGAYPRMYIHDPKMERQWRDVEVTMFFQRISDEGVPYAGMTAIVRSNHLDTESGNSQCDTRGIGARIRYDGRIDFEKETAFPDNEAVSPKVIWPDGMPRNQWFGYKFVVYDLPDGRVKLELWFSKDGSKTNWKKINEVIDDGTTWGEVPCAKGIDQNIALTKSPNRIGSETGKPNISVYFRSDSVNKNGLQYKWGSVREIQPK
jgi:hypothetical protein